MKTTLDNPFIGDTLSFTIHTPNLEGKEENPSSIDKIVIAYMVVRQPGQREMVPVYVLGDGQTPVWTEGNESHIKNVAPGQFELNWSSAGQREGNYIIHWFYNHKNDPQVEHTRRFYLASRPYPIAARHDRNEINPKKYEILLDRYLPSVYKSKITEDDQTPEVIEKLHFAIGHGFQLLENLAVQLTDVTDANYTQEALLPLLASFFDWKLKTDNVTSWRRQIKRAMPLFKAKGTLSALKEALEQVGIRLNKLTRLWQVTSPYVWIESFKVKNDNNKSFELAKQPLPNMIKVSILPYRHPYSASAERQTYLELPSPDFVKILDKKEGGGKYKAVWQGDQLEEPIDLFPGDIVRLEYQYRPIPPGDEELAKYIMSLPLADDRNEEEQDYPRKNWNVRLIEEDDPLFDRIIKDRHPFSDPVVFGKIRTTFMYSEKIYNMDTYDGSLRDSINPCDIDKDFIDTCANCQSSKFNVDLEITNLCNDKVHEAYEIIKEQAPFHAILNAINIKGRMEDFVLPPTDVVESQISHKKQPQLTEKLGVKDSIKFKISYRDGSTEQGQV